MQIDTKRAQALKAYLAGDTPLQDQHQRIEIRGQVQTFRVHRLPIKQLIYNIRNGRFASELLAKEKVLERTLDATKPADGKIIQKILLEQNASETEALRDDLKRHGQIEPGIVTYDGAVINANRRMAVLAELYQDNNNDEKWAYLKASVLPENVDEKDLWRIEAGLQFSKDFRLEYGPVNELLKLKEGIQRGLSPKEISQTLLGRFTPAQVDERLNVLKLIETYLVLIGKPKDYVLIQQERDVEKFNSLHSNVIASLKRRKRDTADVLFLTNVAFGLINKTDFSHWEIRRLAKIAESSHAFKELKSGLTGSDLKKWSKDELEEAFRSAKDITEDQEEHDKPERLIKRALAAVTSVDKGSQRLHSEEVRQLLNKLKQALDDLVAAVGKKKR